MKSILISIRPEWVAKILNGEKTIEIRKTAPKCDLPIEVYIYCTKSNPNITDFRGADGKPYYWATAQEYNPNLNGKVVAKFILRKVELIHWQQYYANNPDMDDESVLETDSLDDYELVHKSCLKIDELEDYIGYEFDDYGYAWRISDLQVFDEPKDITEFYEPYECGELPIPLTRAPQSWRYVEVTK